VPFLTLYGAFEIDDSFMILMEHVNGTQATKFSFEQKLIATKEVEQHRATFRSIKSDIVGGPSGLVIPLNLQGIMFG
jgi:hypothetical protein